MTVTVAFLFGFACGIAALLGAALVLALCRTASPGWAQTDGEAANAWREMRALRQALREEIKRRQEAEAALEETAALAEIQKGE